MLKRMRKQTDRQRSHQFRVSEISHTQDCEALIKKLKLKMFLVKLGMPYMGTKAVIVSCFFNMASTIFDTVKNYYFFHLKCYFHLDVIATPYHLPKYFKEFISWRVTQ